jgi:crotonobetainyl-CoA:carnitine CoA-transferase CaiB-like acyl-CoA transferase
MDNFRPGVLRRLGLAHDDLAAVRNELITSSVTSFGDVGPLAGEPGMDPLIQALSGIMAAQGGDSEPVGYPTGPADVIGGVASALGVCLALFHRARGHGGQHVTTSLLAGSIFLQSGELVRYASRVPAQVGGRDHPGTSAIDRFYATADGHVRVHAANLAGFVRAGLLRDASVPESSATKEIADRLSILRRAEALKVLDVAGVPAVPARHLDEVPQVEEIVLGEYLTVYESIDGATIHLPARFARFSRTNRCDALRTPGIGEHSRELLTDAGVPAQVIDAAIANGHVKEGGPVIWFSAAAGQW